ncbi:glycerophosphodiester phosphodiesterase family protein [Amnibacterium kyonggiense]|uniref:glycerophosphodiester phosphodiesterase n=1 Tax=Amnibacterium kyonggiense TaxID=595671 RepID=A0A4R7FR71_9MICO|nr:glycerophosphodiester phosphodiesterase family protein [Amnibacterium kyonggiense]TDS80198.1 glycerophosphoryl diester phosphodiesterase [Amnibacterium kyonggiense]
MPAPLVIAHRGACGYRPELTRSAFRLALEQGAKAIEVDVVASADGELVVRHDPELSHTTDVAAHPELRERLRTKVVRGRPRRGWFAEDLTLPELRTLRGRERLPRLRPVSAQHDGAEEVLTLGDVIELVAAAGDVRLVVELKHAARSARLGLPLDELLAATLERAPRLPGIVVESFEHDALDLLAARGLPHPLVALIGHEPLIDHLTVRYPERFARFDGVSLGANLVTPRTVAGFREVGLDVWTWTLRPENRFLPRRYRLPGSPFGRYAEYWRRLQAAGVTGLFADHPDLAHAVLGGPPGVGVPTYS